MTYFRGASIIFPPQHLNYTKHSRKECIIQPKAYVFIGEWKKIEIPEKLDTNSSLTRKARSFRETMCTVLIPISFPFLPQQHWAPTSCVSALGVTARCRYSADRKSVV